MKEHKVKIKTCECGKDFEVKNFCQKYCSPQCQSKFKKPKEKKKPKPIPKISASMIKELVTYRTNRDFVLGQQIKNRGNNYCERCQKVCQPECHHIIFRSEAPKHKHLHFPANLFLCCNSCHRWFHERKENRIDIVKERNLKLFFNHLAQ